MINCSTLMRRADAIFFSRDGRSLITRSGDEFSAWIADDGARQANWRLSDALPADLAGLDVKIHGRMAYHGGDCLLISAGDHWQFLQAAIGQPVSPWALPEVRVLAWNRTRFRILPTESPAVASAVILPITQIIYESRSDGRIGLLNFPTGKDIELKLPNVDWGTTRSWLSEHFLAIVNSEGSLSLISLDDGRTQCEIPGESRQINEVLLNDDTRHFATLEGVGNSRQIVLRNSSDGRPVDNEKGVWKLDPGLFSAQAFAGKDRVFSIGRRMDGPWELIFHDVGDGQLGVPNSLTWRRTHLRSEDADVVPLRLL
ncbi:MAG: hypothetical protein V9H26_10825 [Verrucomicrobiota bacterium]